MAEGLLFLRHSCSFTRFHRIFGRCSKDGFCSSGERPALRQHLPIMVCRLSSPGLCFTSHLYQASSPGLRRCPNSFIHALLHPFYCDRCPYPSDARQNTRTSHGRRRPNSNSVNPYRQWPFSLDNVWTVSCHPPQWHIR